MVGNKGLYWEDIWKFHFRHNHPPDEDLLGHPEARDLSANDTEIALNALKAGAKSNHSPTSGNQSWINCDLTGY